MGIRTIDYGVAIKICRAYVLSLLEGEAMKYLLTRPLTIFKLRIKSTDVIYHDG